MGCGGSSAKTAGDQDCATPGSHSGPWICGKPPLFSISTPIWTGLDQPISDGGDTAQGWREEVGTGEIVRKTRSASGSPSSMQYLALRRSFARFDFSGPPWPEEQERAGRQCSGTHPADLWKGRGSGGERGRPVLTISAYGVHGPERASKAAVDACLVIRCLPDPVWLI
jgi:hypothetical protein